LVLEAERYPAADVGQSNGSFDPWEEKGRRVVIRNILLVSEHENETKKRCEMMRT
jgi:hypothetical protein